MTTKTINLGLRKIVYMLGGAALCLCFVNNSYASSENRLKIYSSQDRATIEKRLKDEPWARITLNNTYKNVDKYVDIHQKDTTWIISRMQMYWKNKYTTPVVNGARYSHGQGEAPVPTVRFTGARDWASEYKSPALENIKPYMDYRDNHIYLQNGQKAGKPWEWVENGKTAHIIENINVGIMNRAMNSAFIYWLTGEQKYAKFAYDIFITFIEGMHYRTAPTSVENFNSEKIMGLTSFEVIHEKVVKPMTLCYDFLGDDYIAERGADRDMIHGVFQKFADRIIDKGVAHNNWNIFQALFITHLALSLDADAEYANGKGSNYYIDYILNHSSANQRALREVCNTYDQNTGFWNESPAYSISTTKDLIAVLMLVDGVDNKNILDDFSIVETSALSAFEYMFPNMRTTAFGDSGYATIPSETYESMLTLYRKYGLKDKEDQAIAIINKLIEEGIYNRDKEASLYRLFNYVSDIPNNVGSTKELTSSLFYAQNISLTVQRNGMDRKHGLTIVNSGTGFNHDHDNGINMELYGLGYPLGMDFGPGSSYWVANHREFYSKPIAHNTVIVDGKSGNGSGERKLGEQSKVHKFLSCYPHINKKDAYTDPVITYTDHYFHETKTNSNQRRLNSIIRTSDSSGYYIDIFRSAKKEGGDIKHEYVYHNMGQSFRLFDAQESKELSMSKSEDLTSAAGMSIGYNYLKDKKEIAFDKDFKGTFELNFDNFKDKENVSMDVWIKGYQGRKLFSAISPHSIKALKGVVPAPMVHMQIPTMIIRQEGEAWTKPFVAIYEPYGTVKGASIKSVEYLDSSDKEFVGIEVSSKNTRKEYILSSTNPEAQTQLKDLEITFSGTYGVVSKKGSKLNYIFMGSSNSISFSNYAISSKQGEATVLFEVSDQGFKITSDKAIILSLPYSKAQKLIYINEQGKQIVIKGIVNKKAGSITFELPALDKTTIKLE